MLFTKQQATFLNLKYCLTNSEHTKQNQSAVYPNILHTKKVNDTFAVALLVHSKCHLSLCLAKLLATWTINIIVISSTTFMDPKRQFSLSYNKRYAHSKMWNLKMTKQYICLQMLLLISIWSVADTLSAFFFFKMDFPDINSISMWPIRTWKFCLFLSKCSLRFHVVTNFEKSSVSNKSVRHWHTHTTKRWKLSFSDGPEKDLKKSHLSNTAHYF